MRTIDGAVVREEREYCRWCGELYPSTRHKNVAFNLQIIIPRLEDTTGMYKDYEITDAINFLFDLDHNWCELREIKDIEHHFKAGIESFDCACKYFISNNRRDIANLLCENKHTAIDRYSEIVDKIVAEKNSEILKLVEGYNKISLLETQGLLNALK